MPRKKKAKLECEECGETEGLYLHARCHMDSPTWAIFYPPARLRIVCAECGKEIGDFMLAVDATVH